MYLLVMIKGGKNRLNAINDFFFKKNGGKKYLSSHIHSWLRVAMWIILGRAQWFGARLWYLTELTSSW